MRANDLISAESLIPHRGCMKLIEWVKSPTPNSLEAEATVREEWPLNKDRTVSSLLAIELAAQAISALSTWIRGRGSVPRVGLLVGIKEAEFSSACIPIGLRLKVQVEKLYQVGNYAVFQSRISSESSFFSKMVIQVIEPEEEILALAKIEPKSESEKKE
jgi:predicted hotdog family 3-hydroxylacyl-ACP dehydratase